ncbi:MAG: hypothetical protein R2776_08550 [Flavobacteriaceae bacterium]|nr:hypothetical protein [Flavobacteriaceae bacterium]
MPKGFNLSQFFIVLLAVSCFFEGFSQSNSQVYVVDIVQDMDGFQFENFRKISSEDGYNSQPFFKNNSTLLYAKNNQGQTDIGVYNLTENSESYWNLSTQGGEYSPQPVPESETIAAVRLDPDGLQRLHDYRLNTYGEEVISHLVVAYYVWYNKNTIVSSVIENNELYLMVSYLKEGENVTLLKGSGRSFHKVPNAKAISYTAVNEEKNWDVYQLDMDSLDSYFVVQLPIGIQDMIWYNDATIMVGSGSQLFAYDLYSNGDWQKIADFSDKNITNITRLAVSPDGSKLALVAEIKNK